jgi:hypothetical protein
MATGYRLAFDLGGPLNLYGMWPLLIVPVVGTLALLLKSNRGGTQEATSDRYLWGVIAVWTIISVILIVLNFVRAQQLLAARSRGDGVVEGCLTRFHPEIRGGHEGEQLDLNGTTLTYSFDDETPAFHRTETHGGPVHRGSRIKANVVNGHIIRLETIDHGCPVAPDWPAEAQ